MSEKKNPFQKASEASAAESADVEHKTVGSDEAAAGTKSTAAEKPSEGTVGAASDSAGAEKPAEKSAEAAAESSESGGAEKAEAKPKKLTATQERDKLREEVAELRARLDRREETELDVSVATDQVLAADGVGGETRKLADGNTVMNEDWRMTRMGLVVLVGRASAQANTSLKIPTTLLASLHELTGHYLSEIAEQTRG